MWSGRSGPDFWSWGFIAMIAQPSRFGAAMVGVAQLVEHLVVVQVVAGSSPVTHPKSRAAHTCGERRYAPPFDMLCGLAEVASRVCAMRRLLAVGACASVVVWVVGLFGIYVVRDGRMPG
jgi:hypothetical protein